MNIKKKLEQTHIDKDMDDLKEKTDTDIVNIMKDSKMVERYSKYLNKCFFMTNDPYMKMKHQRYLEKTNQ